MQTKRIKIKDICTIKSGKRLPKGASFSIERTSFPYIRARDINNGRIDGDNLAYIDYETKATLSKYIVNKGDVVITVAGTVGNVAYVDDTFDNFNLTENAVRLTNFRKDVNSKYIAYLLNTNEYHDHMEMISGGVAQPKLGIYKIEKIQLNIPDIATQNRVVEILDKYNKIIQNNSKLMVLLDNFVFELFKEKFIRRRDFESTKDSVIGKIPQNYEIKKIRDIVSYSIGGGWGEELQNDVFQIEAAVIRGADFPYIKYSNVDTCQNRFHKKNNFSARKLHANDIIVEVSGGTQDQPVGRTVLVTNGIIEQLNNSVICASFCKLLRVDESKIDPIYFYYWMQYLYETRMIEKFQLQSTGIINFKFDNFLNHGYVLIAPHIQIDSFSKTANLVKNEIDRLAIMNKNLKTQYNLLLPSLMSGKIEVK